MARGISDRPRRAVSLAALMAVLSVVGACDATPAGELLGGGAGVGGAPAGDVVDSALRPQHEPCSQAAAFSFAGEATLDQLGLGAAASAADATRPGVIWVTRDPVDVGRSLSRAAGFEPDVSRFACVEWPDGSGLGIAVEDGWEPPAPGPGDLATTGGDLPTPLIVLLLAAALVAGASYLAFRQRPDPGTGDR